MGCLSDLVQIAFVLSFLVQVPFVCYLSQRRWCLCVVFPGTGGVCALSSWYRWCVCITFPGTGGVCVLCFLVQVVLPCLYLTQVILYEVVLPNLIQVMLFGVFCGLITDKGVCGAVRPDTDDAVCTEMLCSIRHVTHLRRYLTRCW